MGLYHYLPVTITAYYKGGASGKGGYGEYISTRRIESVVGDKYFGMAVRVAGIIPTSYVLWAMYNSQVSLGLKRLVSFTVLSTLRPLPTPQMSDALVNALTTIENALFLQNFEISGS